MYLLTIFRNTIYENFKLSKFRLTNNVFKNMFCGGFKLKNPVNTKEKK